MNSPESTSCPILSIIVINYNLVRELPRTLFTLSPEYQRGVNAAEYEVIVVDNGSNPRMTDGDVSKYGRNFHLLNLEDPRPSPAYAINAGVAKAKGALVAVMIDGARMASPGIVRYCLDANLLSKRAVTAVLSWHLGPDLQFKSVLKGYNQKKEDELLARIPWQSNGYELFAISTFAQSASRGFFLAPGESNFLTLPKALFEEIGGCDERFDLPGGGLVNQDMLARAIAAPDTRFIMILGEGTFHQYHGGAATSASGKQREAVLNEYAAQYLRLRGFPYRKPVRQPECFGHIPPSLTRFLRQSVEAFEGNAPVSASNH